MIVLAVCTEGENSEPNYIEALKNVLFGTVPGENTAVEVVPVPLGGNHGFRKIFEKAKIELELRAQDPRDILSALEEDDKLEKWMIVDYDKMHKHGVSEEWMRGEAARNGYAKVADTINDRISDYNNQRGFDKDEFSALRLPKYSKGSFQSKDLFWRLLDQNMNLLDIFDEERCRCDDEHYTEMWKIIERMRGLARGNNGVEE